MDSKKKPRNRIVLIIKGVLGSLFQVGLFGSLLLVPPGLLEDGTWVWKRAIYFLAAYGLMVTSYSIFLEIKAPDNLEARLKPPVSKRKQPLFDQIVTIIILIVIIGWLLLVSIDVFYLRLFPAPSFFLSSAGGVLSFTGIFLVLVTIYQNEFAIPYVEDQSNQGQYLVNTGLYAIVRHPMYMGLLLFFIGLALWLESYTGLVAVALVMAPFIARIIIEEKTLIETLPGYKEYMKEVKYRLIPYLY